MPLTVDVVINGTHIAARPGDTLAAAMLAASFRAMRRDKTGQPRGMFCNMGTCFECMVTLGDATRVRACVTDVTPGMFVTTGSD